MSNAGLLLRACLAAGIVLLTACNQHYRDVYEIDARQNAENACQASGVSPNDEGYNRCFQSHFDAAMAKAPTTLRPFQRGRLTDLEICENYGFQWGTDDYAGCLQHLNEKGQRARLK